ncbi:MAG TPA: DUF262 domain-containing protein [Allosphingosinicella sp.]|nr:DUF262 domain-containing protein [Allosphingosinicella sp.]
MSQPDNFLHTTHRTVTWFRKAFQAEELTLSPPFQRNAVWTNAQKSYLIDTILNGLPIPELYMQDVGNEAGDENHIVVDGQQRIRAVLDFTHGNFSLEGQDVARSWRNLSFEDLTTDQKKAVFGYKFVVRILPAELREEDIRKIFARINKNTVSLTDQEIRNATYWGPFIKAIQFMADEDPFWAECGLFSANDHRRMNDQEYISELAAAYLHGPQNKKDKLDQYYQAYEEQFEDRDRLVSAFRKVTSEISRLLPRLTGTRWRKKSDFYTLFLELARREQMIPRDDGDVATLRERVVDFGSRVDSILLLEQESWQDQEPDVVAYARNVARAASDRGSRMVRAAAFSHFVFGDDAQLSQPAVEGVNGDEDPAEPSESTEASAGGSPTT